MACGIYSIKCLGNGKMYIGRTIEEFRVRWYHHLYRLKKQKHSNSYIQNAYNKYGEESLVFDIIEEISDELCRDEKLKCLSDLEVFYIEKYETKTPKGFNMNDGGGGNSGVEVSEETRRKISIGNKGKTVSEESRKKISLANSGENHHMFGKTHSDESKRKNSESNMGKIVTAETRKKIGDSRRGEKHPMFGKQTSDEARKNMSIAKKGKKFSEEHKKNLGDSRKGKKNENSSSKYMGVYVYVSKTGVQRITCRITLHKKNIYIGRFSSEIDAAKAWDKYITENNIDRPLNFPNGETDD